MLRHAMRSLLESRPDLHVVGDVDDGLAAVETARSLRPHVALTNLSLRSRNGIDTIGPLRDASPDTRVILLADDANPTAVAGAVQAGASAVVVKTEPADDLFAAFDAVIRGTNHLSPHADRMLTEVQSLAVDPPGQEPGPFQRLTPREREVLQLVAEGKTTKEIAWTLALSTKTVHFHRNSLEQKLGLARDADLTKYAIRHGLSSAGRA